jgi:hypothetical protein
MARDIISTYDVINYVLSLFAQSNTLQTSYPSHLALLEFRVQGFWRTTFLEFLNCLIYQSSSEKRTDRTDPVLLNLPISYISLVASVIGKTAGNLYSMIEAIIPRTLIKEV